MTAMTRPALVTGMPSVRTGTPLVQSGSLSRRSLPRRSVEDVAEGQHEGKREQQAGSHPVEFGEKAQHRRRTQHPALTDDQQAPPIKRVGQSPGGQRQHEEGKVFGGLNQRHHQGGRGQLRHQPARSHLVHPGSQVGDHRGNPEGAEHLPPQRRPGRSHGLAFRLARRRLGTSGLKWTRVLEGGVAHENIE